MDIHIVPGVKAKDVAEAHRKDLFHQEEFGCKCMTYWIDEKRDSIFCLIDAPDKETVKELHSKAHGLVPNKIIEVSSSVVESFLGRIFDPEDAISSPDGLKIFSDPSFRILLVTRINDPALLRHQLGMEKADDLLSRHNAFGRQHIAEQGGTEVEHDGPGFIASFDSAGKAMVCALNMQKDLSVAESALLGFTIGINGGEPVGSSNKLFGDTIQFARHLCAVCKPSQVAVASNIKELVSAELYQKNHNRLLDLPPQEEDFLQSLFTKLEERWQDPDFGTAGYCKAMAMSQSQFYRKTTALTGDSFNALLKDFRLEKARKLMKKQRYSISQITFDSGFTSPSYFTKCFKKKYGLLPMTYIDLQH
ncbi:MAG TPA: nickel-binding protein [Chitinophagaceae bacterium]|nr:nickel-binding protein [Chitinophagaceae bacterium]